MMITLAFEFSRFSFRVRISFSLENDNELLISSNNITNLIILLFRML